MTAASSPVLPGTTDREALVGTEGTTVGVSDQGREIRVGHALADPAARLALAGTLPGAPASA